jgi:REP element-mobilizing transposase RayT
LAAAAGSGCFFPTRCPEATGLQEVERDHVHMFVKIPPHVSVSDFVRHSKRRSSRKIQQEFEHIRTCHWGQRF